MSLAHVSNWTIDDVQNWLQRKGLEQYQETFLKNKITGSILAEMDDFDLEILEIKNEDRLTISYIMDKARRSEKELKSEKLPAYHNYISHSDTPEQKSPVYIYRRVSSSEITINKKFSPTPFPKKHRSSIGAPSHQIYINPDEDIYSWNKKEVCTFLRKNAMTKYCFKFLKNSIDGEALLELKVSDFQELGLKTDESVLLYQTLKDYKKTK